MDKQVVSVVYKTQSIASIKQTPDHDFQVYPYNHLDYIPLN